MIPLHLVSFPRFYSFLVWSCRARPSSQQDQSHGSLSFSLLHHKSSLLISLSFYCYYFLLLLFITSPVSNWLLSLYITGLVLKWFHLYSRPATLASLESPWMMALISTGFSCWFFLRSCCNVHPSRVSSLSISVLHSIIYAKFFQCWVCLQKWGEQFYATIQEES